MVHLYTFLHTGISVKDAGVRVADKVIGHDLLLGVAENALKLTLTRLFDRRLDLVVGGGLGQAHRQIHNGDIRRRHAQCHAL